MISSILKCGLPRVAVVVIPNRGDRDRHRLMLEGASVVRFANKFLDAYKKEKNLVFMAIYIGYAGATDRYILYQNKGSQKVCAHALHIKIIHKILR